MKIHQHWVDAAKDDWMYSIKCSAGTIMAHFLHVLHDFKW